MAAIRGQRRRTAKLQAPTEVVWDSFRRGLNLLLQDIELQEEELKRADNLILKGAGILTQRPGTANYFLAGSGKVRGLQPYYSKSGTKEILALTDAGYFVRKNNASYSIIPGSSFPSGTDVSSVQIYDKVFLTSTSSELRKYDGTTIYPYVGLSRPTSLTATKSSGTTGAFTWSWRVSSESGVGETLASDAVTVDQLPENLTTTNYVTISWSSIANAAGYVIYGREPGGETYLTRVPPSSTTWLDTGSNIPSLFSFPPESDFTAGPQGKIMITQREHLVIGNISGNPSRVVVSGGGPNIDKFHWSKGGFYIDVNKDDGEEITGLAAFENKIIVWKTRSTYQVTYSYNADVGTVEPTVQQINGALGCVAPMTVTAVENDIFFVGQRAGGGISLNSLGYEPNFTTVLRTKEISARVRPELESVNQARSGEMWSIFWKNIYWLFYPVGTSVMKCIGYDRERLAWLGPFNFPNNPARGKIFYDSSNLEHVLYGDGNDGYVTEISDGFASDKGVSFSWTFLSRKEFVKDPFRLKNLQAIFTHLRNVKGQVSVAIIIEDTSGVTNTAANFTVSGNQVLAGWGSFAWGKPDRTFTPKWGYQPSASTTNTAEIIKYIQLNKSRIRSYQVQITGTGSLAEIIAIKGIMTVLSPLNISAGWRTEA
jgi:hypothetical protein